MNNTGLLMSKPGESGYSKLRRFMVANKSVRVSANIKHDRSFKNPQKTVIRKQYDLAKFALDVEHNFLKQNGIKSFSDDSEFKDKYRPIKCCSKCMKIGFHSYVFDYQCIENCPVHNIQLENKCPTCNHPWSTFTSLKANKCQTCGLGVEFHKALSADVVSDNKYKIFKLIEELIKHRSNGISASATLSIPSLISLPLAKRKFKQCLSHKSHYIFSILKCLDRLNIDEYSLLKSSGIRFYKSNLHTFKARKVSFKDFQYVKSQKIMRKKIEINNGYALKLKQLLQDRVSQNHKLGSCVSNKGVCATCLPWLLFASVISSYKFPFQDELESLLQQTPCSSRYVNSFMSDNEIFGSLVIKESHISLSSDYYFKVPDELMLLLHNAELWMMVQCFLKVVDGLHSNEHISRSEAIKLGQSARQSIILSKLPIAIWLEGDLIKVIIPKVIDKYNLKKIPI